MVCRRSLLFKILLRRFVFLAVLSIMARVVKSAKAKGQLPSARARREAMARVMKSAKAKGPKAFPDAMRLRKLTPQAARVKPKAMKARKAMLSYEKQKSFRVH